MNSLFGMLPPVHIVATPYFGLFHYFKTIDLQNRSKSRTWFQGQLEIRCYLHTKCYNSGLEHAKQAFLNFSLTEQLLFVAIHNIHINLILCHDSFSSHNCVKELYNELVRDGTCQFHDHL